MEIKYTRGAIDAAVTAISQRGNEIERELDELYTQFTNLFSSGFTGEASAAFQQAQQRWDAGAKQIHTALATLGVKLNSAGNDMFDADGTIARTLQS